MRNKKGQFLKGHQPTFEEKQKICENIKKSWKNRKDYIGDLIEKRNSLIKKVGLNPTFFIFILNIFPLFVLRFLNIQ